MLFLDRCCANASVADSTESTTVFTPAAGHKPKKVRMRQLRLQQMAEHWREGTGEHAFTKYVKMTRSKYGHCGGVALLNPREFAHFGWREGEITVVSAASIKGRMKNGINEGEDTEVRRNQEGSAPSRQNAFQYNALGVGMQPKVRA